MPMRGRCQSALRRPSGCEPVEAVASKLRVVARERRTRMALKREGGGQPSEQRTRSESAPQLLRTQREGLFTVCVQGLL